MIDNDVGKLELMGKLIRIQEIRVGFNYYCLSVIENGRLSTGLVLQLMVVHKRG